MRALRQILLALVAIAVLAACGGGADTSPTAPSPASPAPPEEAPSDMPTGTLVIDTEDGPVRVRVEIAERLEHKARGLMDRESLPADAGMVFLEEQPTETGFWMKDTLIPLSIAFWDEEQRIRRILDMEPCEKDPCPIYDPEMQWVGAVEVNQGFFQEHGVEVGDRVRLERNGA